MSAAAIRKIYVLHTLVQGAIFTRSSTGDGIHTRGESQSNANQPSNIYTSQHKYTADEKDNIFFIILLAFCVLFVEVLSV